MLHAEHPCKQYTDSGECVLHVSKFIMSSHDSYCPALSDVQQISLIPVTMIIPTLHMERGKTQYGCVP